MQIKDPTNAAIVITWTINLTVKHKCDTDLLNYDLSWVAPTQKKKHFMYKANLVDFVDSASVPMTTVDVANPFDITGKTGCFTYRIIDKTSNAVSVDSSV